MHRRRLLGILSAAALLLPMSAVAAVAADANSTALEVEGVVTVSSTEEGSATGLEVAGQDVSATDGEGSGHLASTSDAGVPADAAEVTLFATEVESDGSSSADAVSVRVGGDGALGIDVLHAETDASGSSAGTQGVHLSGGDQHLTVGDTHADERDAGTALLDLDGERMLTDEDTDLCDFTVAPLIDAEVLCADVAEDETGAGVLQRYEALEQDGEGVLRGVVLEANAGGTSFPGSPDPDPTPASPAPSPAPSPSSTPSPAPSPTPTGPSTPGAPEVPLGAPDAGGGVLPNTGAAALLLLGSGLGLIGSGGVMVRRRR